MSELQELYKTGPVNLAVGASPLWVSGNGSRRQARLVDISFWARTGGVNWPLLRSNQDGVIIRAGQGYWGIDPLLNEHIDMANANGVPYATYWQTDRRQAIEQQTQLYARAYGVKGHRAFLAHEKTGGGIVTSGQAQTACVVYEQENGEKPKNYSRLEIMANTWGKPAWITDYEWWIAHYPVDDPYTGELYKDYDAFIEDHEWEFSSEFDRLGVQDWQSVCHFWQFTNKLDARKYFANERTNDPKYPVGLLSGDGNVSTIMDAEQVITWLGGTPHPPKPPNLEERVEALEELTVKLSQDVTDLEREVVALDLRVTALENKPPAPPDPDPETVTVTITEKHKAHWFKAWDKSCGSGQPGKPTMLTDDNKPALVVGDSYQCHAKLKWSCHDDENDPIIYGDGMREYYQIAEEGTYQGRFIRADKSELRS